MTSDWLAGHKEKRWALIVASVCVLLILIALLWPKQPDSSKQESMVADDYVENSEQMPPTQHIMQPQPVVPVNAPKTEVVKEVPAEQVEVKVVESKVSEPVRKPIATPPVVKAPATILATKAPAIQSGSYIQVGSFKSINGAIKVADALKAHGWPAIVAQRGADMHAVQVGPYADKKALSSARSDLKNKEKLDGFIVRH